MNAEARLFNISLDSDFLLAETRVFQPFFHKNPSNLRKILRKRLAKERTESFNIANIPLNTSAISLQRAAENLKLALAPEIESSDNNVEEFSYASLGSAGQNSMVMADRYINYCVLNFGLAGMMQSQWRNHNAFRRELLGDQFASWDAKMESVMESTQAQVEN